MEKRNKKWLKKVAILLIKAKILDRIKINKPYGWSAKRTFKEDFIVESYRFALKKLRRR